jgi:hypothetical protein
LTQSGHERLRIAAVQLIPEPHSAGRKSLLAILAAIASRREQIAGRLDVKAVKD